MSNELGGNELTRILGGDPAGASYNESLYEEYRNFCVECLTELGEDGEYGRLCDSCSVPNTVLRVGVEYTNGDHVWEDAEYWEVTSWFAKCWTDNPWLEGFHEALTAEEAEGKAILLDVFPDDPAPDLYQDAEFRTASVTIP